MQFQMYKFKRVKKLKLNDYVQRLYVLVHPSGNL